MLSGQYPYVPPSVFDRTTRLQGVDRNGHRSRKNWVAEMGIASVYAGKRMAPQVGLEPTTLRLTAECSAIELLRNMVY